MIDLESFRKCIGLFNGGQKNSKNANNDKNSSNDLGKAETKLFALTLSLILLIGGIEFNPGPNEKKGETTKKDVQTSDIVNDLLSNQDFRSIFKDLFRESIKAEMPALINPVITKLKNSKI